jgi:hypothetical protein
MKLVGMVWGPYTFCKAERTMELGLSKLPGYFTLAVDVDGT